MWNHEVHIQSFEWNENRNSAYLLSMVLPYLQSLRTLAKFVLSLCSIIWRKKTRICCSLHELFVKSERFCKVRQITSWPTWNWSFFFWLVRCAYLSDLQLTSRRPFRLLRTIKKRSLRWELNSYQFHANYAKKLLFWPPTKPRHVSWLQ